MSASKPFRDVLAEYTAGKQWVARFEQDQSDASAWWLVDGRQISRAAWVPHDETDGFIAVWLLHWLNEETMETRFLNAIKRKHMDRTALALKAYKLYLQLRRG
ncbi:hypothetical protein [Nonomuraea jiangxiensis]|uniref:Uncharacterized protein n=1 Tax=Nonomuraea jiangxiensis TaxID=633440 RepID=A0A1G8XU69_9ACTN|nr:hypothetical protein [Nonomuraea jiangxiensis]SDJ93714.1 hypothetical protein SAMN05421869_11367 [Nonomuraea jiangxiensis]